jgi:hypothetical protein
MMKSTSKYQGLILAGIILASLLGAPIPGQKAKIEQKDGLTIVHNPKQPVQGKGFPSKLSLKQDLCIGKSLNTPWLYFICDDVGGFYVQTFEKNNKGHLKWDYFDKDGVYRLFFFLPAEEFLYYIRNNKAYSFINENEDGIPIVIRYLMEWR